MEILVSHPDETSGTRRDFLYYATGGAGAEAKAQAEADGIDAQVTATRALPWEDRPGHPGHHGIPSGATPTPLASPHATGALF